jgi:hypothetical protein
MSPVHSLTKRSGERLFYLDLRAGRIKRALNANALAFELGNVGLVIDVIGLAGIILQHILVAGFHDCSRECLASTRGGGGIGHVVLRAGGLRLIRSLRRRRLLRRRRCIGRRSGLRLRSLLRRRVGCRRRLRRRLICRCRWCGLSKRAAPGDQAKDHCQGGDKSKRLNPIFHKSSRSQAAHPRRVSKLRAITSSRLAAPLVRREKEIGFARLSERSSGSPDAQFRHCFFSTTLDAVVESPAFSSVSQTIEHFLLTQKKTIPCDTKPTRDFPLHYVDQCRWGTRPSDRISGTTRRFLRTRSSS